jgi:hypothetical protein
MSARGNHTVYIARLPETVGYVPMLSCRTDGFGSGAFAWAGDSRARQSQTFESLDLDRRFVIEVAKGQDQVWLYRLFSPSMVDWLASETPPDFGFRLSSGAFECEAPRWRGQHRADGQVDSGHLDLLAGCGGRVAGRLRDEVLEQVGLGNAPDPRSAAANRGWTGGRRHGRLVGALLRIGGVGRDDSIEVFATELGFEPEDPAAFHAAHILLPLPGAATDVFRGVLPGTGREARLAWLEYESDHYGERHYVAVVAACERDGPAVWFDPEEATALAAGGADGLPARVAAMAGESGLGVSTGGGSAAVYLGSTGWDGRPGKDGIRSMLEAAGPIFDALEDSGTPRGGDRSG